MKVENECNCNENQWCTNCYEAKRYCLLGITQPTTETMQCDEGCEYECTKGGTQPKSCETLQEGDWTKCEKFSEWVALNEIEGMRVFDGYDFDLFNKSDGKIKLTDQEFIVGKGENFLPYQEFKSRAENTFKTK